MRFLVTAAVLMAVVATALVAVCQHSETRRLQHNVWQLERRSERLERTRRRLEAAIEAARTPRRLLLELDGLPLRPLEPPCTPTFCPSSYDVDSEAIQGQASAFAPPAGFVVGDNFEGGVR